MNLVKFQPKLAQNTILEAVHDKVGTYELRPLLQQVQEGMKLDQDLSKKFGLQPLAHELRLSEKVLNDCNFIRTENYNNKVQDTENVTTRIVSNDDIDIKEEICYWQSKTSAVCSILKKQCKLSKIEYELYNYCIMWM